MKSLFIALLLFIFFGLASLIYANTEILNGNHIFVGSYSGITIEKPSNTDTTTHEFSTYRDTGGLVYRDTGGSIYRDLSL